MGAAPKISLPSDEKFAENLSGQFTDEELAVVELVILGPEGAGRKGQPYVLADIESFHVSAHGERASLSHEILEILAMVAQTGRRTISKVVDGQFIEAKVEIIGATEVEQQQADVHRQIVFTISMDSSILARLSGGRLRSDSATSIERLALTKRAPDCFSGGLKSFKSRRLKRKQDRPPHEQAKITDDGLVLYSPIQQGSIYSSLLKFKDEYKKIALALKLSN